MAVKVLEELVTVFRFRVDDRALGQAAAGVDQFSSKLRGLQSHMSALSVTLSGMGYLAARGVRSLVTRLVDFRSEMNNLGAILQVGEDQLVSYEKRFRYLGRTTRYTSTEVARAAVQLAYSGLRGEEAIKRATETSLNMAAAGRMPIDKAARILTSVGAQFDVRPEGYERLADLLAYAATRAKSDISGLGVSLSNAGVIAHQLHMGPEQALAAVSILRNVGIEAEKSGVAMRNIINRLAAPTPQVEDEFRRMGIDPAEMQYRIEGGRLAEAFDLLNEGRMTVGQAMVIFNARTGNAAQAFKDGVDDYRDLVQGYKNNSKGFAKQVAEEQLSGIVGGQFALLNAWIGFQEKLGDSGFEWFMDKLMRFGAGILRVISELPRWTHFFMALGLTVSTLLAPMGFLAFMAWRTSSALGALDYVLRNFMKQQGFRTRRERFGDWRRRRGLDRAGWRRARERVRGWGRAAHPREPDPRRALPPGRQRMLPAGGGPGRELVHVPRRTVHPMGPVRGREKARLKRQIEHERRRRGREMTIVRERERQAAEEGRRRRLWRYETPEKIQRDRTEVLLRREAVARRARRAAGLDRPAAQPRHTRSFVSRRWARRRGMVAERPERRVPAYMRLLGADTRYTPAHRSIDRRLSSGGMRAAKGTGKLGRGLGAVGKVAGASLLPVLEVLFPLFGVLTDVLLPLIGAFGAFKVIIATLGIAALVGMVWYLWKNWDQVLQTVKDVYSWFLRLIGIDSGRLPYPSGQGGSQALPAHFAGTGAQLPRMQRGGKVPGPKGSLFNATLHAGELVLPPEISRTIEEVSAARRQYSPERLRSVAGGALGRLDAMRARPMQDLRAVMEQGRGAVSGILGQGRDILGGTVSGASGAAMGVVNRALGGAGKAADTAAAKTVGALLEGAKGLGRRTQGWGLGGLGGGGGNRFSIRIERIDIVLRNGGDPEAIAAGLRDPLRQQLQDLVEDLDTCIAR